MITPRDFLGRHHVPEVPFSTHELGRRPVLLDPAAAKDQDSVHSGEHRSAVRHNQGRAPLGDLLQPLLDRVFRPEIEVGGRFVQDQDRRSGDEGSGEQNSLALAKR